jgi:hypothetical protein
VSGIYGGSGSQGGGIYGGASAAPAPAKHHGLLHDIVAAPATFTGHLLGDVRDAAVGLPAGLVMSVEHPIRSAKVIGKTTWKDWSPLFHGHPGEWAQNFYDHPLAPILDVVGVVSGGAALAARGGEGLAAVGAISKEGKLAQLSGNLSEARRVSALGAGEHIDSKLTKLEHTPGNPTYARHLDSNPVVRLRQEGLHRLTSHMAEVAPKWFGRTETESAEGTILQKGRIKDFSPAGRADRHFQLQESYRSGATRAMIHTQLATFVKAGKDLTTEPGKVFRQIETHGREQLETHAYRVPVAEAHKLGPEYGFVRDVARTPYAKGENVHTVEDFQRNMEGFATRHVTRNLDDAMVKDGQALVVHMRAAKAWQKEAQRSATFLTKLYRYPTKAWKYLVLATRPAYFVNNAVGNTFMAMATLGPVPFTRGLVDAYRQAHGERAAAGELEGAMKSIKELHGDWQDKHYLGVHQGFGQEALGELKLNERVPGHPRVAAVVRHAEQGFYPITHKVADVFLRRVMVNALLRKHGAVRGLMDQGVEFDKAAEFVSRDPLVRDKIQEQVNNALGDYHHLGPVEKQIRNIVPFYTWDRAIVRHGVHLGLDRTGRTAVGANVGQMGTEETTKALGGNIPDFLKGVIALGGHSGDRTSVMTTQGLNPYASIPDVADLAGQLVGVGNGGSDVLAGQINPIITGAIESATGQSLLSGAKLPKRPGGVIGQTAANVVEGTPIPKLVETLIKGEAQPKPNKTTGKIKPFLYRKDVKTQVAALLGVPVKELNKQTASDLADKQHGTHKKKRRSSGIFG